MGRAAIIAGVGAADTVQLLRFKERRLEAMRALVGSLNSTDLRRLTVTDEVRDALIAGTSDPYPPVRWGCLQLLDHLADPAVLPAICTALEDPVPRVRRLATHALGCGVCKPAWDGALPPGAVATLGQMATSDVNAKVRAEARGALAAWGRRQPTAAPSEAAEVSCSSRRSAPARS